MSDCAQAGLSGSHTKASALPADTCILSSALYKGRNVPISDYPGEDRPNMRCPPPDTAALDRYDQLRVYGSPERNSGGVRSPQPAVLYTLSRLTLRFTLEF
jgi:hypothetical protein